MTSCGDEALGCFLTGIVNISIPSGFPVRSSVTRRAFIIHVMSSSESGHGMDYEFD